MNRLQAWMAGAALVLLAPQALAQKAPEKKVYCWNEDGRTICGDALPAAAVDNARTEIDVDTGMTTRSLDRAPTDAERAAAEAQARREKRQAMAEAARLRREMAMVESYATEDELRRAFAHRSELLDEAVKTSRMSVVGMRQSLVGQLQRAGGSELAGKPVGKALAVNIRNQHRALLQQQQLLAEQLHERAVLDEELADAVDRYRELKSPAQREG